MFPFEKPPTLGIGVMYNPALSQFVKTDLDAIDYLEITSDMFWTDRGPGRMPRFEDFEPWVDLLDWVADRRPVIAHNVGLSIASAGRCDEEYVAHLAEWYRRYNFPWHSDHLSFFQVSGLNGRDHNAGVAVPVPCDHEILAIVADRVLDVRRAVPAPFLLENGVYYIDYPEQDMTEPQFLNRLTAQSGCGLLLDVHNLYANARNHRFNAFHFIDEIDLSRVVEVHVAGGNEFAGMYTDAHAGPCPEPVWELLAYVVVRASQLCGVTFEFHDSYYHLLGTEGVRAQLDRARSIWTKYRGDRQ